MLEMLRGVRHELCALETWLVRSGKRKCIFAQHSIRWHVHVSVCINYMYTCVYICIYIQICINIQIIMLYIIHTHIYYTYILVVCISTYICMYV